MWTVSRLLAGVAGASGKRDQLLFNMLGKRCQHVFAIYTTCSVCVGLFAAEAGGGRAGGSQGCGKDS